MKRALIPLACPLVLLMAGCTSTPPTPAVPPASVVRPVPPEVQAPAGLNDSDFNQWLGAERKRVTDARASAQQQFSDAEMACWQRFAVNDCVSRARADRRTKLTRLRDEELALNLQERQRTTAARLKQLDEKQRGAEQGK